MHELTLRHCGVRLNPGGPVLALGIPDVGRGLVTLRVKGLCIPNHISGEVGQILRNLHLYYAISTLTAILPSLLEPSHYSLEA